MSTNSGVLARTPTSAPVSALAPAPAAAGTGRTGRPARGPAPRRHDLVPFIAGWSGEERGPMPVVVRRGRKGIGYADERSYDRDAYGVLWERTPSQPGRGEPQFGAVHSLRQRLCMTGLRCQICGGPADRTPAGVLWLIDAERDALLPGEEDTAHPPVCRPCAHRSVHACPHLHSSFTAVRVRACRPSGVKGTLYRPTAEGPVTIAAEAVEFGDRLIPWVLAYQFIMRLLDFTVIDLNDPTA